jgi:hypothetical protein
VKVGLSDTQDGPHLVEGDIRLLGKHHAISSDAGTAQGRHGNDRDAIGNILQQGTLGFRATKEGDDPTIDSTEPLVHRILILIQNQTEIGILTDTRERELIEGQDEIAATAQVLFLCSGAIFHKAAGGIEVGQIQHSGIIPFIDEPLGNENTVIVLDTDLGLDRSAGVNEHVNRLAVHCGHGHDFFHGRKVNPVTRIRNIPALPKKGQG